MEGSEEGEGGRGKRNYHERFEVIVIQLLNYYTLHIQYTTRVHDTHIVQAHTYHVCVPRLIHTHMYVL